MVQTFCIGEGQKYDERIGRPRTVRSQNCTQDPRSCNVGGRHRSQTVVEIAAAESSHVTCHNILSHNLNMSSVTQHGVPRLLEQDLRDDHISTDR
jgi:hypothetical protein